MTRTTCDEMWNAVTIYGPQPEIDRFRRLCIVRAPENDEGSTSAIDFDRIMLAGAGAWGGEEAAVDHVASEETWNFRDRPPRPGVYHFAFDTLSCFPTIILQHLARLFPSLAFDCDCIRDDDSSMGFGWFNTPAGGEDFHVGYDVPEGYWESGEGIKRDATAELRHRALTARMEEAGGKPTTDA